MNCLVLGGAGFIGSHLCDALFAAGHYVRVFEKRDASRRNIEHLADRIEMIEGDFSDARAVCDALKGMEVVYHLIGTTLPQSSNTDIPYDLSSNVIATVRMLDGCIQAGVSKVIFASSGGTVYGIPQQIPIPEDHPADPICSYGIHKLAIEKYLQLYWYLYGLDYTILRVANPFGPRQPVDRNQGAVAAFIHKALCGEPIEIWGDGSTVRDYIHISDVSAAFLAALTSSHENRIFNIGSGIGRSLLEIIVEIEKGINRRLDVRFTAGRKIDVPVNVLATERAERVMRWAPSISFQEGIAGMLQPHQQPSPLGRRSAVQ